jgi:catechol 2,3-dioxygenase-like lactoylglutathione lyase family enzyme
MQLGVFSISLAVKDIAASRAFYGKLGFTVFGGNQDQRWLIMKNGTTLVGLFQGMFERNTLTFNPGWDSDAQLVPGFTDVRELEPRVRAAGLTPVMAVKPDTTGPGFFVVNDPDGNPVLVDQHV